VRLRHVVEYGILRVLEAITRPLSRNATISLAGILAFGMGRILRARRRIVEANLDIAFGKPTTPGQVAQRQALIHENYRRTLLTFLEFIQASVRRRDIVVGVDGADRVLPLAQAGPVLMVTGHIGNWEAFGVLLGDYSMRGAMLAKPIHNRLVQERVLSQRRSIPGVEIILTSNSMKAVVRCIREGRHVGFVADQDARRNGIFVPFFGKPASTARGPALFAYKLGLPLIPLFMIRDPSQQLRLRLIAGKPILPDTSSPEEEEIYRITADHTAQLESIIRQYPEDYFWMHNRWKTQPKPPKPPKDSPQ
jgi:KDO2-lipid IV(A) lauroyltransferase